MSSRNLPVQSKSTLITEWPTPTIFHSLHCFLGIILLHNNHSPQLVSRTKPLRELQRRLFRHSIPPLSWTPDLLQLFTDTKTGLTSPHILSHFSMEKVTTSKSDWNAIGMPWITMQPANDPKYLKYMHNLLTDGTLLFDLTADGPHLRTVEYFSRACI